MKSSEIFFVIGFFLIFMGVAQLFLPVYQSPEGNIATGILVMVIAVLLVINNDFK